MEQSNNFSISLRGATDLTPPFFFFLALHSYGTTVHHVRNNGAEKPINYSLSDWRLHFVMIHRSMCSQNRFGMCLYKQTIRKTNRKISLRKGYELKKKELTRKLPTTNDKRRLYNVVEHNERNEQQ